MTICSIKVFCWARALKASALYLKKNHLKKRGKTSPGDKCHDYQDDWQKTRFPAEKNHQLGPRDSKEMHLQCLEIGLFYSLHLLTETGGPAAYVGHMRGSRRHRATGASWICLSGEKNIIPRLEGHQERESTPSPVEVDWGQFRSFISHPFRQTHPASPDHRG